jgi:hypothetical protein
MSASRLLRDSSQDSTPPAGISSTPPIPLIQNYPGTDYNFLLQSVLDMQKSIGALTNAVDTLAKDARDNAAELRKVCQDVHTTKTIMKFLAWAIPVLGVLHEIWHPLLDFLVSHTR